MSAVSALIIITFMWTQVYSVLKKREIKLNKGKQLGLVVGGHLISLVIVYALSYIIDLAIVLLIASMLSGFTFIYIFIDKKIEGGKIKLARDIIMSSIWAIIYSILAGIALYLGLGLLGVNSIGVI